MTLTCTHRTTHHTDPGSRERNEDRFRHVDRTYGTIMVIADGFSKADGEGARVANDAVRIFLEHMPNTLSQSIERSLAEAFQAVAVELREELSGTTLSVALITESVAYVFVVGDSPVIISAPEHGLITLPHEYFAVSGDRLARCFGDRENRKPHRTVPERRTFMITDDVTIIVGSDGLFPATTDAKFTALAEHYVQLVRAGMHAEALVVTALARGATNNVTALAYRRS